MTKKQKYLNSEAHGYLLESDACALLIKELERVCTKFQRRIDKENAARQADFDAAMEYHSENEDHGCLRLGVDHRSTVPCVYGPVPPRPAGS